MPKKPLLLDVDTGVDDAMAIALATRLDDHQLVGITTVAGNVPLDFTTLNTQRVLEWLGVDIPIYRGMSAPLARPLVSAGNVHGDDGLGGWNLPAPSIAISKLTAPEAIIRLAREHAGEIDFAFVGPLTNLAVAVLLAPDLPGLVSHLVIMGGAFFNPGNVTPEAEFNIYVDPEAAAIVAAAGFNATWVGLDVTHQTVLDRASWEGLSNATSSGAQLVREVCRRSFEVRDVEQVHLHDPLALAVVAWPDLIGGVPGEISIDVGAHARGRTRVSTFMDGTGQAARSVDVERFHSMFARVTG